MKRPVLAFGALMALDALLTSIGIGRMGISPELNPIAVALYASAGLAGLWLAKVAIGSIAVALTVRFGRPRDLWPVVGLMGLLVALNAIALAGSL